MEVAAIMNYAKLTCELTSSNRLLQRLHFIRNVYILSAEHTLLYFSGIRIPQVDSVKVW